jgi:hypothetical protein
MSSALFERSPEANIEKPLDSGALSSTEPRALARGEWRGSRAPSLEESRVLVKTTFINITNILLVNSVRNFERQYCFTV